MAGYIPLPFLLAPFFLCTRITHISPVCTYPAAKVVSFGETVDAKSLSTAIAGLGTSFAYLFPAIANVILKLNVRLPANLTEVITPALTYAI